MQCSGLITASRSDRVDDLKQVHNDCDKMS